MNFTILKYEKVVDSLFTKTSIFMTSDVIVPKIYVGADPGTRNLGISVYVGNLVIVNQIKMKAEKNPVQSMINIMEAVKRCIPDKQIPGKAVIEGASYGEKFGQTSLAESRAAIMLILHELNFDVSKVPPTQVRKLITGSGKDKGECFDFPSDSNASFLCLLVVLLPDV